LSGPTRTNQRKKQRGPYSPFLECYRRERGDRKATPLPGPIPAASFFSGVLSCAGEEGGRGIDRRLFILPR